MTAIPASPELDNDLVNPATWAEEARIRSNLAWLRANHCELAGKPRFAQASFVGGLKSLPIRNRMK